MLTEMKTVWLDKYPLPLFLLLLQTAVNELKQQLCAFYSSNRQKPEWRVSDSYSNASNLKNTMMQNTELSLCKNCL